MALSRIELFPTDLPIPLSDRICKTRSSVFGPPVALDLEEGTRMADAHQVHQRVAARYGIPVGRAVEWVTADCSTPAASQFDGLRAQPASPRNVCLRSIRMAALLPSIIL
jgi:hypothetical protein